MAHSEEAAKRPKEHRNAEKYAAVERPEQSSERIELDPSERLSQPSGGVGSRSGAQFHSRLQTLENDALQALMPSVEKCHSVCDNLFAELSQRAASDSERALYFDSQQELQRKKKRLSRRFERAVRDNLRAYLCRQEATLEQSAAMPLSLLAHDELDVELAITGIVSRTDTLYHAALSELHARCNQFAGHTLSDPNQNPLAPKQLCRSFVGALAGIAIETKLSIVVLKQFERYVLNQLGHCYSQLNRQLLAWGIDPNTAPASEEARDRELERTPFSAVAGDVRGCEPPPPPARRAMAATVDHEYDLHAILSEARARGADLDPIDADTRASSSPQLMTGVEAESLVPLGRAELVDRLEQLDCDLDQALRAELVLPRAISQAVGQRAGGRALDRATRDTVQIAVLFFEALLADDNITEALRLQISRLQIPVLKIALIESDFFRHSRHPARQLVELLAAIGIELDHSKPLANDPIYSAIETQVQVIIDRFSGDESVFAQALANLQQRVERERMRAAKIERRLQSSERGKSRLVHSQREAWQLLIHKISGSRLPEIVRDLLLQHWVKVLTLVHLKHGEHEQEWIDAVQVVDDLIWASQYHPQGRATRRLKTLIPDLVARIGRGMQAIAEPLERHRTCLRAIEQLQQPLGPESYRYPVVSLEQIMALQPTNLGTQGQAESSAIERQQSQLDQRHHTYLQRLEQIQIGDWFEYWPPEAKRPQRCKLSCKIEVNHGFVFVNRFGFKVFEKTRYDLAHALRSGHLREIDKSPIISRVAAKIQRRL